MHHMNGAELTIALLERQGITTISGIPGGTNLPLYTALSHSKRIRHVLARHEQGAGFIAQGMARSTGQAAVCFATSGPGATNLLTAIADAKLDSTPIVCITGQVHSDMIGTDAFQEVDIYGMSIPITKHNFQVRSAAELLEVIPQAFELALSGRPGPVLVDIPKDVQTEILEFADWPVPGRATAIAPCNARALENAARMIAAAKRPILYVGGGVVSADAGATACTLAENNDIPMVTTMMALGAIRSDHPLNLGMFGMHGSKKTNLLMQEADLLIVAGARFDDRATGKIAEFCPQANVIHIDIDASEIHKLRSAHIGVHGDVGEALTRLNGQLPQQSRPEWIDQAKEARRDTSTVVALTGKDHIRPFELIRDIADHVGEQAFIATDVGQHQMWTAQHYPFCRSRHWLTSGGLGTMGFGLPTAIGAALANPDNPVVCFSGDGSFLMNIQELATLAQEQLNVKIILLDNQALGLVRQQQSLFYDNRLFASEFAQAIDFVAIAQGFGIKAMRLTTTNAETLANTLRQPGPCLIHVPIDRREMVFPMVPPGAANTTMLEGECHACA